MEHSSNTNAKHVDFNSVTIGDIPVPLSSHARNLGVIFDNHLSMERQINNLIKTLNYEMRRIAKMKSFLTTESLRTLVCSLVLSRLDYCNSLLAGLPDKLINKLQRLQNNAARLVLGKTIFDSPTEMLIRLHWLPIKARIIYKISLFCYKSIIDHSAPVYIDELLSLHQSVKSLRSNSSNLLSVPRTKTKTFGDRAFGSFGPKTWNSLPLSIRNSSSPDVFKKNLKTHLFNIHLMN